MGESINRSIREPIREDLSWAKRWKDPDRGLITAWEVGRRRSSKNPELARRAKNGELPLSNWKGGVENATKKNTKWGTLTYLAEWQGLRGEDLDIDPDEEITMVCPRTGMKVTYTADQSKYANQ